MQHTKDEIYLLAVYDLAVASGDPENAVDRYVAGTHAGISERAVNAISNLLIKANFIKKSDEQGVYLTPHGISLVKQLRLD